MRRGCNCKRVNQPPSIDNTFIPKMKSYWESNIGERSYEELTYDEKQKLNIYFHDIYPLNKTTDGLFIYNKLKNLI